MPRGEYDPVPQAQPQQLRRQADRIDVPFPDVRFSDAIGQALQDVGREGFGTLSRATQAAAQAYDNMGNTLEGVGNKIFERAMGLQELENETKVNNAAVAYGAYEGQERMKIDSLKGEGANSTVLAAKQQEWEAKRQELRNTLPLTARKSFDGETLGVLGSMVNHAATHFSQQTKLAAGGAATSLNSMDIERSIRSDDPAEVERLWGGIEKRTRETIAPINNWSKEETELRLNDLKAEIAAGKIKNVAETDSSKALEMLEANRKLKEGEGVIDSKLYEQLHTTLMGEQTRQQGRNIGLRVQNDDPEASLSEKEDKARKMAEEVNPHNPDLPHAAVAEVDARHNKYRQDLIQEEARNLDKVHESLYGYANPDGKMPTTPDELFAPGPEYKSAYEHLNNANRNKIDAGLRNNAKGDFPETEATRRLRWELDNIAQDDPARFKDMDFSHLQIPISDRVALHNRQLQIKKEGIKLENDPNTARAMGILSSNGILTRDISKAGNLTKYNQFAGGLREAIQQEEKILKYSRPLNEKEIITIGRVLLDKISKTGWFGTNVGDVRLFESQGFNQLPDDAREHFQSIDPTMTEQDMLEQYQMARFQHEYELYTTKGPSESRPVPPRTFKSREGR